MQLTVDIRAEEFLARLRGTSDRLHTNMVRVVTRLSVEVQAAVKEKLTGQVLHVRTGTLRRSINRKVEENGSSITATIGTNVVYAGVHEFGFDGTVTVKAHDRQLRSGVVAATRQKRKGATEKPTVGVVHVREYARHMVVPERSFLRSTLKDFTQRIQQELRAAAIDAI